MNDQLCVCMFSNLYPPVVSGSSIQTSSLARELVKIGHEVVVITANVGDNPDYEVVDGVHVYRLPAIRLAKIPIGFNFPWLSYTFTPGNIKRIEKIIDQHQPHVLHLHNYMFDLSLSAALIRRKKKIPLAITIHTYLKHASPFINLIFFPVERIVLNLLVIRQSDCVICPDLNVQNYVSEAFGRMKTALVPYGIDLLQHAEELSGEELAAKYHLEGKRVILSLGHLHAIRNRKDLIEAMPAVLAVYPNAVLFIAGAVSTQFPIELARKLNVQDAVLFAGTVPHQEVPALLELADMEAHWMTQDEPSMTSLGIASLEAMLAGKAVLAAANPNTYGAGILKDGENIIIVEPDNSALLAQRIISLLHDDKWRQSIGFSARQTVRDNFSWQNISVKTVAVYRDMIRALGSKKGRSNEIAH